MKLKIALLPMPTGEQRTNNMKKLFLLIVSLFFLCVSCDQKEEGDSQGLVFDYDIFISNTSTNNYLIYYTNNLAYRDINYNGMTILSNNNYAQFNAIYSYNYDDVVKKIDKYIRIKFYDSKTTNFLFKITNKIHLLKNKLEVPTNDGLNPNLWLVISDSTFTNAYWGTTNE